MNNTASFTRKEIGYLPKGEKKTLIDTETKLSRIKQQFFCKFTKNL
jgi:hypothetical protein